MGSASQVSPLISNVIVTLRKASLLVRLYEICDAFKLT